MVASRWGYLRLALLSLPLVWPAEYGGLAMMTRMSSCALRQCALAVRRKGEMVVEAAVFGHVEGVGEHDPIEGNVAGFGSCWVVSPWYVASMLMAAM